MNSADKTILVLTSSVDRYKNFVRRSAELMNMKVGHAYDQRTLTGYANILLLVLPAWQHGMGYKEEREVRESIMLGKSCRGWTVLYLNAKQEAGEEPIVP